MHKVVANTTPLIALSQVSLERIQVAKIENQMAKAFYKTQLHDGEVKVMIIQRYGNG